MSDLTKLSDRDLKEKQILILRDISRRTKTISGWVQFIGWAIIISIVLTTFAIEHYSA